MKLTKEEITKFLDDHAAWLQDEETGKRADFSTGKWRGVDLHGANLQNAFLGVVYSEEDRDFAVDFPVDEESRNYETARTELQGANLSGANLQSADFSGADLSGADLSGANLRGADMSPSSCEEAEDLIHRCGVWCDYKSYKTDLSGANLSTADLSGANLYGANLTGADLSNANLRGANLRNSNLTDAKFKGADLSGANLTKADLTNADLTYANLSGVKGYKVSSDDSVADEDEGVLRI